MSDSSNINEGDRVQTAVGNNPIEGEVTGFHEGATGGNMADVKHTNQDGNESTLSRNVEGLEKK